MNGTTTATATLASVLDPAERWHHRLAWLSTVDHKRIAILYLLAGLFFFVVGGVEALFMRLQLAVPNNHFLQPDTYNQLFTMHGTTMIFLVVMPLSFGLVNYFLPLQIGARDMAFPRLNALGFWLIPFGGILLHFSVLAGGAPAVGWFSYTPLSETPYSSTLGVDYWAVALFALGIGSISFAINVIATVTSRRAPGMTMRRLPLFTWINFVNAFIIILALPVLNAGLAMLLIDRQLEGHFFLPFHGGSAVLWQHIFWAFGHPEVYIMVLPAFGIVSEVIPVFSRKPIFGYEYVAGSSVAIAILSMSVWGHHMFTVGMGRAADSFFAIASPAILHCVTQSNRNRVLKAETAKDVRPMLQQAFKYDGPALVEVLVHRQELSMPPTITFEQATGFGIFMLKAVMSGRGDEIVDLARTNLLW
jgi:cytochrome c oxidase subunit I+III